MYYPKVRIRKLIQVEEGGRSSFFASFGVVLVRVRLSSRKKEEIQYGRKNEKEWPLYHVSRRPFVSHLFVVEGM